MRPHRLELTAFGAFPGQVCLDFDELGQSGLVLLCGDTGGGKTTLLDAMGFALYGVVPGERAKARDDLRSHHAAPDAVPWVRLVFSARGQRLRVTRSPEWQRPKSRGGGTVKQQASAHLERWDGAAWSSVAQRLDDVGLEVSRLVGMDAGQFFQVVLLPQGRFAAFLQADHRDREKLLKQLFRVSRFEDAERWLLERAAAAASAVVLVTAELERLASRVAQETGTEPPAGADSQLEWASDLLAAAELELAQAVAASAAAKGERRAAEAELAEVERLAGRQSRRLAAEAELRVLEAGAPQMADVAAELSAAERARPVVVLAAAVDARRAELDRASRQEQRARALLRAVLLELPWAGEALGARPAEPAGSGPAGSGPELMAAADATALRSGAGHVRVEAGRIEALRAVTEAAAAADRQAAESRAAADRAGQQVQQLQELRAALPGLVQEADAALTTAQEAARRLPAVQLALDTAQRQLRAVRELAAASSEAARAAVALQAAEDELTRTRQEALRLREQRFEAITAELAALLVPDSPCPVCGSLEHPDVAEVGADDVSRSAEKAAEELVLLAERAVLQCGREASAHEERVLGLQRQVEQSPVQDVAPLQAELAQLTAHAGLGDTARAALGALQTDAERSAAALGRAEVEQREHGNAARQAAERAALLRDRLESALGADVDVEARLRSTLRLAEALDGAARSAESAAVAGSALSSAELDAGSEAGRAAFPDLDSALAADRPQAWCTAAGAATRSHAAQLDGVVRLLASADLAVATGAPAPLGAAAGAAHRAAEEHERAGLVLERATRRRTQLATLVPAVVEAVERREPLRAQAAELRGLAELAAGRGANRLSMPLSTFVLAARLEEVADAASARLTGMSRGRYTLQHTDSSRDRRARAGLGLQVQDSWTGRTRDTATLSGGETFMTALSLALGLADVVTAEAGGQTIDALFVDEGFGSLDVDSLDQVMDSLDELRSGGRLVGLVSHVADLRQRIPAQITVIKSPGGSTVRTTADVTAP